MGQYTLQGDDALSFGPLAGTLMACPEPVMAQATRYTEAMAAVSGVLLRGDRLELHGPEGEGPELTFARAGTAPE
jgi:heat shock protein HslJ